MTLYHLVAINDKTKTKQYLTSYPMTHEKVRVMLSKQSNSAKDVRFMFEPVSEQ